MQVELAISNGNLIARSYYKHCLRSVLFEEVLHNGCGLLAKGGWQANSPPKFIGQNFKEEKIE